jgi:hypothetical protein
VKFEEHSKASAKAGTIAVTSVQTTVRVFGFVVVNWDVGVDDVSEGHCDEE